jgi:hypothetical protein
MKQLHSILYSLYELLQFFIVAILLTATALVVMTNSWHYLLLYIPVLFYIYKTQIIEFIHHKHTKGNKKS